MDKTRKARKYGGFNTMGDESEEKWLMAERTKVILPAARKYYANGEHRSQDGIARKFMMYEKMTWRRRFTPVSSAAAGRYGLCM